MTHYQGYKYYMALKPGRPKKIDRLDEYLEVRTSASEKQAFRAAAELAGIPLATWVRERLRRVAVRELEEAGHQIPFLK